MNIFENIEYLNKGYFVLLIFVPVLLYIFYKKQINGYDFGFLKDIRKNIKTSNYKIYIKITLLFLILLNFIILLANPNTTNVSQKINKNGIDIVIALDISGSMEAEDLKPNRIEAAKNVINNFIGKLKTDRLGLVVFAGKPFTSIPLTFDYNILSETIGRLSTDNINQQKRGLNGTAIGDAILMSKTLFKAPKTEDENQYKKREKVIILLTDGDANTGVDPILASLSAKDMGIKIYTIGIGSKNGGTITYNVGPFKKQQKIPPLNDKVLKEIAKNTGGEYFRADNNNTFRYIFDNLSKLEKNDINIEVKKEYAQYYDIFIYSLAVLLLGFTYLMISAISFKNKNEKIWN